MSAYVIVDIEVANPEGYKEYVKMAPEAVKLYGGRYIISPGAVQTKHWRATGKPDAS